MSHAHPITLCDAAHTARLLDYGTLVDAIATAAADLANGAIHSPERLVLPLGQGGVLLSMPATAPDIGVHKLVTVLPDNPSRQLPTIHGAVSVCEAATGQLRCLLDGPEVTGRRTAAVSLLAIRTLLPEAPREVLLIGTGVQARFHAQALAALYPQARVWVRSRHLPAAQSFCDEHRALNPNLAPCPQSLPDRLDVVITCTTATAPVYDEPATVGRLVIGVGAFKPEMAELGTRLLEGSQVFADDPSGARHEAGDLLRAGVDWSAVGSLAAALRGGFDRGRPVAFKSVGTAAWDLAAARVALAALQTQA